MEHHPTRRQPQRRLHERRGDHDRWPWLAFLVLSAAASKRRISWQSRWLSFPSPSRWATRRWADPSNTWLRTLFRRPDAAASWVTFADQRKPRPLRARFTNPLLSMTCSMVATVVAATGRLRPTSARTWPRGTGPE